MMTIEQEPSSSDDASQKASAPAENSDQPWWATHPAIIAARDAVDEWLESARERPVAEDHFGAIHTT